MMEDGSSGVCAAAVLYCETIGSHRGDDVGNGAMGERKKIANWLSVADLLPRTQRAQKDNFNFHTQFDV